MYYQKIGKYIHIFDIYVGEGEDNDLDGMATDIQSKPYSYAGHIAPHDMGVYEWGARATRLETALNDYGLRFHIAPKEIGLADGIDMVRRLLPNIIIDESCMELVSALRRYRRKRNPDGRFGSTPEHDGSDFTDPVRYLAVTMGIMTNEMLNDTNNLIDKGGIYDCE